MGKSDSSPLQTAVWRNSLSRVEQLLSEGLSPDGQDAESGWSSLHRALYYGHIRAAALLLAAGAQVTLPDLKGRTPLDLLSAELKQHLSGSTIGELYSWGNGASYQLGSGATGLQLFPARLDALHGACVTAIAASKFHSAALTEDGTLYTWGFGRGGRLGHADFHIHSGEGAVILPQPVAFFSRRQVATVAIAKHHSAAVTNSGELFTWGSNRDGRLGYQAVDTQPTPRKVTAFNRQKVTAVALANRHTVALLEGGAIFSWGSNLQGQLGYGTSDSGSNAIPRIVEAMKGRHICAVAAAKRHTVALTAEGDVYTWGHRVVTPRRVQFAGARDIARSDSSSPGGWEVVFHKGQSEVARPVAMLIAAGAAHSCAVTRDGTVLAWRSMDPALRPQEVGGPLASKVVVAVSAGKYRTAAVTDEGDVYMWEGWSKAAEAVPKRSANVLSVGASPPEALPPEWEVPRGLKQRKPHKAGAFTFQLITPQRVEGVKRITGVAVGEKHSLALQSWCSAPRFKAASPLQPALQAAADEAAQLSPRGSEASALELLDDERTDEVQVGGLRSLAYWQALEAATANSTPHSSCPVTPERQRGRPLSAKLQGLPSLQRLCERCVAQSLVEPRSALHVLEYADAAGARALREHCLAVVLSNLDLVLLEAKGVMEQLPEHLLGSLETLWSRRFPRALQPPESGDNHAKSGASRVDWSPSAATAALRSMTSAASERSFKDPQEEAAEAGRTRQERTIRKKLQQMDALERRTADGGLDAQQQAKLRARPLLTAALDALQADAPLQQVQDMLSSAAQAAAKAPAKLSASPLMDNSPNEPKRDRRRRSRSGKSSAGSSPVPVNLLQASLQGNSPGTSLRGMPAPLTAMPGSSALPPSVPRVSGFAQGASPLPWKGPQSPPMSGLGPLPEGSEAATLKEKDGRDSEGGEGPAPRGSASWANLAASTSKAKAAPVTPGSGKKGKGQRKGGLSMFLAGELEARPAPSPPPAPKAAAPLTWSARTTSSPASLRDILDQEAQEAAQLVASTRSLSLGQASARRPAAGAPSPNAAAARRHTLASSTDTQTRVTPLSQGEAGGLPHADGGIKISLGELVKKSKPITVGLRTPPKETSDKARAEPAWGGLVGGSPPTGGLRLQDIQAEQEQVRESMSRSWGTAGASPGSQRGSHLSTTSQWRSQSSLVTAPPASSPGASFPAGTSPSASTRRNYSLSPAVPPSQNKWYVKEERGIVPLRSIQTEESAIKELQALYGASNVRIVSKARLPRL